MLYIQTHHLNSYQHANMWYVHSCQLSQKPAKRINFYFIPRVPFLEWDPATLQQWLKNNLLTLLVEDNAILSCLKSYCLLPAVLIDRVSAIALDPIPRMELGV